MRDTRGQMRNLWRPGRGARLSTRRARIPRLRAFGAPLGMTSSRRDLAQSCAVIEPVDQVASVLQPRYRTADQRLQRGHALVLVFTQRLRCEAVDPRDIEARIE